MKLGLVASTTAASLPSLSLCGTPQGCSLLQSGTLWITVLHSSGCFVFCAPLHRTSQQSISDLSAVRRQTAMQQELEKLRAKLRTADFVRNGSGSGSEQRYLAQFIQDPSC